MNPITDDRFRVLMETDTVVVGLSGTSGPTGPQGITGEGVPPGGTTGQVLAKTSDADFATQWVDP